MSDEALLIGGDQKTQEQAAVEAAQKATHGASGLTTPMEFVPVSFFGVFKGTEDTAVEQKQTVSVPRGVSAEDIADFVWVKILQRGAFRVVGEAGEINYYPLTEFKRFAFKKSEVVGVTL